MSRLAKKLIILVCLGMMQAGCVRQSYAPVAPVDPQEKSSQNNDGQPNKLYVLGGMTKGQSGLMSQYIDEARATREPLLRAATLQREKKWQEAIAAYSEAAEIELLKNEALWGLSDTFEAIGDYPNAVKYYEQVKVADWARPEYEAKLAALKAKLAASSESQPSP